MTGDYKSLFRNSKFLYLWFSQIFSQVTINIMNFLLLAKLYSATGSTIATSLLWLSYALPAVVFGPIGAAAVDLVSRRKTLMITNLLQALTIFACLFINQQSLFILYAVVLVYSLLNQFYGPAESAYLPSAVGKTELTHANSLFFLTTQASLVLGFGLAGLLQGFIGFNGVIILSAIFLFIAFLSTVFLPETKNDTEMPEGFEKVLKTFFDSILEGYEYIKRKKSVLYPLLLILVLQVGLTVIIISLPVIAVQILGVSVAFVGVSVVVPAGIGAILGSIYVPRILKRGARKKAVIEKSLLMIFTGMILLSLGIPHLPLIYRLLITPLLIVLIGFGFTGVNIPTLTFLQETTPFWFRGRVFGNMGFLITVVTVFPVLFSGAIIEIFGIRAMLTLLAIGLFGLFLYSNKRGNSLIEENFTT